MALWFNIDTVDRAVHSELREHGVIRIQGDVEVRDYDRAHWRDVQLNQVLCAGQQVRLMAKSRIRTPFVNAGALRVQKEGLDRLFCPERFPRDRGRNAGASGRRNQGENEFVLFDATLGYPLPRRYGVVRAGMSNLLDRKFNFRGLNIQRSPPRETVEGRMFAPERTLFARLTFAF